MVRSSLSSPPGQRRSVAECANNDARVDCARGEARRPSRRNLVHETARQLPQDQCCGVSNSFCILNGGFMDGSAYTIERGISRGARPNSCPPLDLQGKQPAFSSMPFFNARKPTSCQSNSARSFSSFCAKRARGPCCVMWSAKPRNVCSFSHA